MDYISFLSLYLWREPMNLISMAKQKDGFLGEQALVLPGRIPVHTPKPARNKRENTGRNRKRINQIIHRTR
jgi:hypothetical protein